MTPARGAAAARALALVAAAIGAAALLAHAVGAAQLSALVPGRPTMVVPTALVLLFGGAGAALAACLRRPGWASRALTNLGIVFVLFGVATLAQYAIGPELQTAGIRARPSPLSATAFVALGLALVTYDAGRRAAVRPREALAAVLLVVAMVSLVGHAHGAGSLYRLGPATSVHGISIPTAIGLLCLGAALLVARPTEGFMRQLTARTAGGALLRRLGLAAVLGPIVAGLIAGWLVRRGVELSIGLALLTAAAMLVGTTVLVAAARPVQRAHDAVDGARARLQDLIDLAPEGLLVLGADGRLADVNPAACRLLGLPREAIVGRPARELVDGALQLDGEMRLRHRDGRLVPVDVSTRALPDGGRLAFVRDASERRAADEERRRWQARLDGIIEVAADAIITLDGQRRIVIFNRGAEAIFGWSRGELLGQPLDVLLPERLREAHRAHLEAFARGPTGARRMAGERALIAGRRKHGEEFPADASISRLELDGEVLLTVVLRDISDRVNMERELRDTRTFLENVLDSATEVAIVAADAGGRILSWNEGARRLYGRADAGGLTLEELHVDGEATRALHERALAGGDAGAVLSGLRGDGAVFSARVAVTRRSDAAGAPLGTLLVAADVTREQRAATELSASVRQNQVLLREVHHRVKNNLQVVSSLLNLQALRVSDPEVRRLFEDSRARVTSIALVHDRLYRSRDLAHVDFDEYAGALLEHLANAGGAAARGVSVTVEPGGVRLPVDQAIPCGMIVTELVTNALTHAFPGERGGRVRASLARAGARRLELTVEDDGVGLPETLDPRDTPSLGLDLVFTFAEQLDAEVDVRRAPGARFTLRFEG